MRRTRLASRRQLLSGGAAAGVIRIFDTPPPAIAATAPESAAHNVRSFGAAGDAGTDNTGAFQRALDTVAQAGGGTLYAPPGRYRFKGTLNVSDGVTLGGSYTSVPPHARVRDQGEAKPEEDGTALFVIAGRGKEDGVPFLALNTNSAVAGLTIYYPDQVTSSAPVPYPWTVDLRGKNRAIFDVELRIIDASQNERHNLRNITGQPIRRGILVDAIYDIGRIENVHFNPGWNSHSPVYQWQMENGEALSSAGPTGNMC